MVNISRICFFMTMILLPAYGDETYHRVMIPYTTAEEAQAILQSPDITVLYNFQRFTKYVDALVTVSNCEKIQKRGIALTIVSHDLSQKEYETVVKGGVFGAFPTYKEIDSIFTYFETKYPTIAKRSVLTPKSYQGRDIFCLTISNSPGTDNNKPAMMITACQHPDEPIGAFMFITDIPYLCENYNRDPEITWLVNNRQIHFVGPYNVDSYVWNESKDQGSRKRKNMNTSGGGTESTGGVDPNRNFPFKWGYDNTGSSGSPTAMNYRGKAPVSEPETKAIIDFCNNKKIRAWQNYHADGGYCIFPYSYRPAGNYSPEKDLYFAIAKEYKKFYPFIRVGNSADCYGSWIVNGGTDDWGTSDSATHKKFVMIIEIGRGYWQYYNDRPKLTVRCDSLRGIDLYMMKFVGLYPVINDIKIKDDAPDGNGDGVLNPGETVKLVVKGENKAVCDTTPAVKSILVSTDDRIQVLDPPGSFGDIKPLAALDNGNNPIRFKCSPQAKEGECYVCSLKVSWTMQSIYFEKTVPCSLRVGKTTGIEFVNGMQAPAGFHVLQQMNARRILFRLALPRQRLNADGSALFHIFDASGKEIRMITGHIRSSVSIVDWDLKNNSGAGIPKGIYFVKAQCGDFSGIQKFVIVR